MKRALLDKNEHPGQGSARMALFMNLFKIFSRNLLRNKLTSIINITALSIGIAGCLFAFLMLDRHFNLDAFHENADNIFIAQNTIATKGETQTWGNSPLPLGPALKQDFPQVERFVRVNRRGCAVRRGDHIFDEPVHFVDEGFMDMFTFPLKYGNKHALSNRNAVILEENTALRYFGDRDPTGKELVFIFDRSQKVSFFVGGVIKELPKTASFRFRFLVRYEQQFQLGLARPDDWKQLTGATFIQLTGPGHIGVIASNTGRYVQRQNSADSHRPISEILFEPLRGMGKNTYKVRDSISMISLHPGQVLQIPISTLFLLLLACFNYMNAAMVTATRRSKEIGIRKVVGGSRLQLVLQFLGENILLCLLALPLGILLAETIILPAFNMAFGDFFNLSVLDVIGRGVFWLFMLGLLLFTGLSAGAYPAFYVSAFQPAQVFRGAQTIGGKRAFSLVLLVFQFMFAFIAVTSGITLAQNSIYQNNLDWGYGNGKDHILVIPIEDEYYGAYKNEIARHAAVLGTAGAAGHIGKRYRRAMVKTTEARGVTGGETGNHAVVRFDVGFDYVETMGLRLIEGRSFRRELSTDEDSALLVNRTLVTAMGWQTGVGKTIELEDKTYHISGVVQDFHYESFDKKIEPVVLSVSTPGAFNYLAVKVGAGSGAEVDTFCKQAWAKLIPSAPYRGYFQEDVFAVYLQIMDNLTVINIGWASVFLFITCIGLYGLVSLNIEKRIKEIGIRKVFGASFGSIVTLVAKHFIVLLIVAAWIALPATYFMLNLLLDLLMPYHAGVGLSSLLLALVIVSAAALLTVSLQVYKAAVSNPAQTLRAE